MELVCINKLSILFLCRGPFGYLGGTDSFMFPKVLAELGHTVRVISFSDKHSESSIVFNRPNNLFIEEYPDISLLRRINIVKNIISAYSPDIVHVYPVSKYYILPILCKAFGLFKQAWLIDIRSPPIRLDRINLNFIMRIKEKFRFFNQFPFDAISSHVSSSAYKHYHKVLRPLYEIPFGVDASKIKKKIWDKSSNPKKSTIKFVYIGSISRTRKIKILLESIDIVKYKYSDYFSVDFYGTGDFVKAFKCLIDQMKLQNTVYYRGLVPQHKLFSILCKYDVGIGYVPYEQYMGAPALKIIEYMAANLLVIASDTNGIRKQVCHNNNGILFSNSKDSISRTMINIIENGCPSQIINNGYNYAINKSWHKVVNDRLLKVYDDIIKA